MGVNLILDDLTTKVKKFNKIKLLDQEGFMQSLNSLGVSEKVKSSDEFDLTEHIDSYLVSARFKDFKIIIERVVNDDWYFSEKYFFYNKDSAYCGLNNGKVLVHFKKGSQYIPANYIMNIVSVFALANAGLLTLESAEAILTLKFSSAGFMIRYGIAKKKSVFFVYLQTRELGFVKTEFIKEIVIEEEVDFFL
jgi:hypothetical protein